jgi:hypothetical protein
MNKKLLATVTLCLASLWAFGSTNEINTQIYLKASKGNSEIERKPGTELIQWAGQRFNTYVVSCTNTAWTPMSKGNVGNAGFTYCRALFTNAGPIVYLSFNNGTATNLAFKAGESSLFRLAPDMDITQICVKASVATNLLDFEFTVIEN